jgi:hypothetical protein
MSPNIVAVNVVHNDDIFIREYALDNVPVLQLLVVQHEYLIPAHKLVRGAHAYVSVGHVDVGEHE